MVSSWNHFGEAKAGGSPLKRLMPFGQVGPPLDCAHPEPSHRLSLPPSGPRSALKQRRGPPAWLGAYREANLFHRTDKQTASFQSKPVRE